MGPTLTSPSAAPGLVAVRTDHLYSAVVVAHGGQGSTTAFLGAQGSAINKLSNVSGTLPGHQSVFTDLTTNYVQSGQTGGTVGDGDIEAFGCTIEQAPYSSAGILGAYGAGPQEMAEILAKVALEIQLVNVEQIKGPLFLFPCLGGVVGAIAASGGTTAAANLVTYLTNGVPGNGRRLVSPIPIQRVDTMKAIVSVPGQNDSLSFSVTGTTSTGQSTLIWIAAEASMRADVRG